MPSTERYCTAAELRTQAGRDNSTNAWTDAAMHVVIDAVSRAIDAFCNRPDGFVALAAGTTRHFPGSGKGWQWIDECVAVSAVAVKDAASDDEDAYTAWTVGAWGATTSADVYPASGDPKRPNYNRLPYTMLVCGSNGDYGYFPSGRYPKRTVAVVEVTARWGYAADVPSAIKQACMIESARALKRGEAGWADALANADFGELRFVATLDPMTKLMLTRYIRPAVGYAMGA